MTTLHTFTVALYLLAFMLSPAPATSATPQRETDFVRAVQKAFDAKRPADLSNLTCWDGFSEQAKTKQQDAYQLLVGQQDVTVSVKLVEPEVKAHKDDGSARANLKVVKQLDVHLVDSRDKKLLGIIGFPVGEKDGRLLLAPLPPTK